MWIPSRFDVVGSYGPPSQDDVTGHASVTSARYLETGFTLRRRSHHEIYRLATGAAAHQRPSSGEGTEEHRTKRSRSRCSGRAMSVVGASRRRRSPVEFLAMGWKPQRKMVP